VALLKNTKKHILKNLMHLKAEGGENAFLPTYKAA
jgi:hypothetical protein